MTRNTSTETGDKVASSIDRQARAGIQLQDLETKMEAIRLALKEGEDSGSVVPFDVDSFIESRKNNHG